MRLIDSHCHFDAPDFDPDREQLVAAMLRLGVTDLVFPAVARSNWDAIRRFATTSSRFHASYGLHPVYLDQHADTHLQELEHWLRVYQPVAVGECGLDYFLPGLDVERQLVLFVAQLRLARDFDLPLIIHARRSVDHVLKYLRQTGGLRGVIHSFAGSQQQADQLVGMGFMLGIGGTITYERARRLRRIVAGLPDECLLLETDAPDQPDSGWRGKRNDPTRLPVIAAELARLRDTSSLQVAEITTANARRLFGLT
ncbi:MAG: TatD family hydrolase [Thiothrix sp.]|nr:TatD family hydrolase [Thiothrix sp.]HPQ96518.1 TatD family hydrolase [Thiolinea sp.]